MQNSGREARRRPIVAALLSWVAPGLGQLYNGELKKCIVLVLCLGVDELALHKLQVWRTFPWLVAGMAIILVAHIAVIVEAAARAYRLQSIALKPFHRWYIYLAVFCVSNISLLPLEHSGLPKILRPAWESYRICSAAMSPALEPGDHIIVALDSHEELDLRYGDVIVFRYPQDPTKDFVKRVIGLGGQVLEIRDKVVFIDGKPLKEPWTTFSSSRIIPAEVLPRDNLPPTRIPDGTVFVMGDNRDGSNDSRFWGMLPINMIRGKALYICRSKDWRRIGTSVASEPKN